MIHLDGVTKLYPGTTAVDDLTFTVEDGEFTVLIGPSGCGKSTTLRMINRLIEASGGIITIDDHDITDYRPEELRRRIGYAIQNVGLFPHMTVAQNISVVPRLLGWESARIERRVEELLELFSLPQAAYATKYPRQLSGGEAQRVGVARALAADPDILLMDEPFGALDPITRGTLQTEFARIQRELKKTIVFVTHDIDEAIRLATRIVILKDGRIVQHDTPENILAAPADNFVLEFIGADRALKRLARLMVAAYVQPAISVGQGWTMGKVRATLEGSRYAWVVDGTGQMIGWIDGRAAVTDEAFVSAAMTATSWRSLGVQPDATLKEALSKMVQAGINNAPVVDSMGKLSGELHLAEILGA